MTPSAGRRRRSLLEDETASRAFTMQVYGHREPSGSEFWCFVVCHEKEEELANFRSNYNLVENSCS